MEANKLDRPADRSAASASPKKTSSTRLLVLLGVLVVALAALAYDYFVATPAVAEAHDKIQQLVDRKNAEDITDRAASRVTSEVVQKEIGKAPTIVKEYDDYTVEYYCWWGPVPFLNTYRQFISVVYVGNDPRRINSHHMNEPPPADALPGYFNEAAEAAAEDAADAPPPAMPGGPKGPPSDAADEAPAVTDTPADGDAPQKKSKKGKSDGSEAPEAPADTETPSAEKADPAEKSADEPAKAEPSAEDAAEEKTDPAPEEKPADENP